MFLFVIEKNGYDFPIADQTINLPVISPSPNRLYIYVCILVCMYVDKTHPLISSSLPFQMTAVLESVIYL